MMSHDRPMDPSTMGYGGMGGITPPPQMQMNPVMTGGYGGVSGSPMPHPSQPGMGMYGMVPQRAHRMPAHLSTVQMKLLSYQMKAYRCLAQNKPIPEPIRNLIVSHATGITTRGVATPLPPSASSTPPSALDPAQQSSVAKQSITPPISMQKQASSGGTNEQSTVGGDKPKEENKGGTEAGGGTSKPAAPSHLKQMKLAPVAKPKGLDPDIIVKEKETRLLYSILPCIFPVFPSISLYIPSYSQYTPSYS